MNEHVVNEVFLLCLVPFLRILYFDSIEPANPNDLVGFRFSIEDRATATGSRFIKIATLRQLIVVEANVGEFFDAFENDVNKLNVEA